MGEITPRPYFYQNLGEAEYVVATYLYMRTCGIPAEKVGAERGNRLLLHHFSCENGQKLSSCKGDK